MNVTLCGVCDALCITAGKKGTVNPGEALATHTKPGCEVLCVRGQIGDDERVGMFE